MTRRPEDNVDDYEDAVLVAVHRLPEPLVADVAYACEQGRALYLSWSGDNHLPSMSHSASLLVAGLAKGEREIPEDVFRLMTRGVPGLPLLLLCDDALTKASVSLQSGRVTLLGPPHTRAKVYGRIRMLLAERGRRTETTDLRPDSPLATRECQRALWWVAGLDCYGGAPDAAPRRLPVTLHQSTSEGLTGVLPIACGGFKPDASQLAEVMRRPETDARKERALSDLVGSGVGVIHLSPSAREWVFYWPDVKWPLLVHSPLRLPSSFDLAAAIEESDSRLFRLAAAAGDLVAGLSAPVPSAEGADLRAAAADGGPVLLDLFERALRDHPAPLSAVLAEVR